MSNDYERREFKKLKTLIDAAQQNSTGSRKITLTTQGCDPHVTISIEAYVLEQFLKEPK